MNFEKAERLKQLPPYLFLEIDKKKNALKNKGVDIIDLGIGNPEIPTPKIIVDAMKNALEEASYNKYPLDAGLMKFRNSISAFMKRRFNVEMTAETNIFPLIGSKEGIAHLPLSILNPGDYALIPEPGYPPYRSGTVFAGGIPHFMPLLKENGFLPDLDNIPESILNKTKLMYLNYPNNPVGVMADKEFYKKAVELALKYGFAICQDAAYTEVYYDSKPISIFEADGAIDCAIEFHSLSKTFSMCGWRVGWATGNESLIKNLAQLKSNVDSGCFMAIQDAAAYGLDNGKEVMQSLRDEYRLRRDLFVNGLNDAGWNIEPPSSTFYVWIPIPSNFNSMEYSDKLLTECHVLCTPGNGFGPSGEGFIRASLTMDRSRLEEAVKRLSKYTFS